MKKVIKIINNINGYTWYKDKIGEQYELKFIDEPLDDYVVDLGNSRGDLGSVKVENCKVLEFEDNEHIRDLEIIPTETERLKEENENLKNDISLIQTALDEIIINML